MLESCLQFIKRTLATLLCLLTIGSIQLIGWPQIEDKITINKSQGVTFFDNFELETPSDSLTGWRLHGGNWYVQSDTNNVLKQVLNSRAYALASWNDYTVHSRFKSLYGGENWGVGVLAHFVDIQNHYRLCVIEGLLVLMKVRDGLFETMAVMPYKLQRGKWYRCKFSLFNVGEVILLQGKVWAAEEIEPLNWQITAEDCSNPLRHGNAGFWTGHSEAIFSELVLTDSDEMVLYSEDFQGVSKGVVPPSFTTTGGKWFIDRDDGFHVLRQISEKPNINFDEAAFAVVALRNYTISSRVRIDVEKDQWEVGLVASDDNNRERPSLYRFSLSQGKAEIMRIKAGKALILNEKKVSIPKGKWCELKMSLVESVEGIKLHAILSQNRKDPPDFEMTAVDMEPLRGGSTGLFCFGAPVLFDDVTIQFNEIHSSSQEVIFQNGLEGYNGCTVDANLSAESPTKKGLKSQTFRVGGEGLNREPSRGVIKFDLSPIPVGCVVKSARLYLLAINPINNSQFSVFRSMSNWEPGQVSWLNSTQNVKWSQHGGDHPGDGFHESLLACKFPNRFGEEATVLLKSALPWCIADVTSVVRHWVNGELKNNGFLLRAIDEHKPAISLATVHFIDPVTHLPDLGKYPRLSIAYRKPQVGFQFHGKKRFSNKNETLSSIENTVQP